MRDIYVRAPKNIENNYGRSDTPAIVRAAVRGETFDGSAGSPNVILPAKTQHCRRVIIDGVYPPCRSSASPTTFRYILRLTIVRCSKWHER